MNSHLNQRNQRTKTNSNYSSWEDILFGVPQCCTLGSLLFNMLLCDLCFIMKETGFASYADDNTAYVTVESLENVMKTLEKRLYYFVSIVSR